MTVLEEYKQSINNLTSRLDNVSSFSCNDETLELIEEASLKLKDMIRIIEDVGIANGVMADALQIMLKE